MGGVYLVHLNDRGRMTPWRSSWGDPGAMPAPQGAARRGPPVHHGAQDRHILGSKGYLKGRSILSADPEYLAQWAGKGGQVGPVPVGEPGSKERVDFGFVVGNWHEFDPATKQIIQRRPTTMGIIHCSERGIHDRRLRRRATDAVSGGMRAKCSYHAPHKRGHRLRALNAGNQATLGRRVKGARPPATAIPDFPVRRFKHSPAGQADQQFWDRIRY